MVSLSSNVSIPIAAITCSICSETFQSPKLLPCGHTFCLNCIQEWGERADRTCKSSKTCPICRQEFLILQGGCTQLPNNFSIIDVLDNQSASDDQVVRQQSRIDSLELTLSSKETEIQNLQKTVNEVMTERGDLITERNKLILYNDTLREERYKLISDCDDLKQKHEDNESQFSNLLCENMHLRIKCHHLTHEIESLVKERDNNAALFALSITCRRIGFRLFIWACVKLWLGLSWCIGKLLIGRHNERVQFHAAIKAIQSHHQAELMERDIAIKAFIAKSKRPAKTRGKDGAVTP